MPEIRPEFMVNLKGKQHPLYAGVLVCAHENGLLGIEVNILQYPSAENGHTAVCQAVVTMKGEDGRDHIFTDIGDASPTNVGPMIIPHIVRMASTRAKGRALRDALALGIALVEEMGPDTEPENGHRNAQEARPRVSARVRVPEPLPAPQTAPLTAPVICDEVGCGVFLSADEQRASLHHWPTLAPVCTVHGRARKERLKAHAAESA